MQFLLCLAILAAVTTAQAIQNSTEGLHFVGVGYNILEGNPEGGNVSNGDVDPGLLFTRKVFKLTWNENKVSLDKKYVVPDQVSFAPHQSCVKTNKKKVFSGSRSYQEKLSVDVQSSEPTKTSARLRLVYKWKSAAPRLGSQDFVADADLNTDSNWGVGDSLDGDAAHVLSPLADDNFLNDFAKQRSQTQVPSQVHIELHQHVHHLQNIQDVNVNSEYCAVGDHSSFSIQEPSTSTRALPPGTSTATQRSITDGSQHRDTNSSGE